MKIDTQQILKPNRHFIAIDWYSPSIPETNGKFMDDRTSSTVVNTNQASVTSERLSWKHERKTIVVDKDMNNNYSAS